MTETKHPDAFDVNDFETPAAAMAFIKKNVLVSMTNTLHEACSVKKVLAFHIVKNSLLSLETHLHEFSDIDQVRDYLASVVHTLYADKISQQFKKWAFRRYYTTVYEMVSACIGHPKIANQITVMVLRNVKPEHEVEMEKKVRLNYFKWQICKLVFQYIQDKLKIDVDKLYYNQDWLYGKTETILP